MDDIKFIKNSVSSDIYFGKGAGTKLLHDLRNASKSVKIVSPFLSPNYIEDLIRLKENGVDIRLITTDEIEDYKNTEKGKLIKKLIIQNRNTNEDAKRKRERLIKINNWILPLWIITFVASAFTAIYFRKFDYLLGLPVAFILFIIYFLLHSRIKSILVYTYSYQQLFPFKVFISPQNANFKNISKYYIHSKIYIIDDLVAYIGSLNFSRGGLEFNFESRVRIIDKGAILGLNEMFNELFLCEDNAFIISETWGKRIYPEPIN